MHTLKGIIMNCFIGFITKSDLTVDLLFLVVIQDGTHDRQRDVRALISGAICGIVRRPTLSRQESVRGKFWRFQRRCWSRIHRKDIGNFIRNIYISVD